jgi:hypothetical protein
VTLGLGRRGLGQTGDVGVIAGGALATAQCNIANLPQCSWLDSLWLSNGCEAALQNCTYGTGGQGGTSNVLALPVAPGAGSITTPELIQQTVTPTGSNVASDAATALAQVQAATAAANPAPAPFDIPAWVWAVLIGAGVLVVMKI